MKRVLIVCDLLHSSPRMPGLVKYLRPLGWDPIVLGPALPPNAELLYGPNSDFHRQEIARIHVGASRVLFHAATAGKSWRRRIETRPWLAACLRYLYLRQMELSAYPDEYRSWVLEAMPAALRAVQNHKVDLVLSSSSPVSMHVLASRLHATTGVPWVADFRDLWTQNYNYAFSAFRRTVERRLELRTIRPAAALISVSDACCRALAQMHGQRLIASIPNGFDPAHAVLPGPLPQSPFRIVYTGTIYRGKQDPSVFLDALNAVFRRGAVNRTGVAVDFYGRSHDWFQHEIEARGLHDVVRQQGMLPREEAFGRQRNAHLLLVFTWESSDDMGVVPLKTYEYLAAGRPILATGGKVVDALGAILQTTQTGFFCRTSTETADVLDRTIRRWQTEGRVPYAGIPERIADYAYPRMAEKFARVFDEVLAPSRL